jgi:hypothetical protein
MRSATVFLVMISVARPILIAVVEIPGLMLWSVVLQWSPDSFHAEGSERMVKKVWEGMRT